MKFRWETEFKETEIGEIPSDWGESKIGIFYRLQYGITATSSEFGNCRLLRQTDLKEGMIDISSVPYSEVSEDKIQKYLLKEDDLVISRIANVGSIGYVSFETFNSFDKPLIFGSYLLKFEKIKEIHNKFTFYFLLSPQMQDYIKSTADGSTRQNTNAKVVAEFPLYVPPLSEQSRIATVLSWFDDLIENKERQNEILEKTAMAIFKSWFIDFEPFRDEEFVYNEELGKEIPKGWEVNQIEKEFYLIKGRKCELSDDYFEGYSPYLLIETFKTGKIEFWTSEKEPQVEENDVVLVADGESSGKVLRYQKGILGSTLLTLKPKRENYIELKHLIYLTLKFYEDEIMSHRTGSAIPHLDKEFLKSFLLLLPPSHILQSFHSFVEPIFQKIILNQKQIMTLKKVRDTFLPLLVFGKLRVEEI
jgi:type I restriction enzyme S subunit